MTSFNIQGVSACSPEVDLGESLGITVSGLDTSMIPVALRRRSSLPTRLAINAGYNACQMAGVDMSVTPTLFASVGGEMLITDQLCLELTNSVVHLSPTQFHNSVHNTAAAYWSIVTGCQQASTAMAAGEQTIAMVFVEACSQLTTQGGDLLVVCYEERWPDYIDPGMGQHAIAIAMLLSVDHHSKTLAQCSGVRVIRQLSEINPDLHALINCVPVFALIPLLRVLTMPGYHHAVPLATQAPYWALDVSVAKQSEQLVS